MTDSGGRCPSIVVPRQYICFLGQGEKFFHNGTMHDVPGTSREIGPAYGFHEKRVTREDDAVHVKGHTARRVPRCMKNGQRDISHPDMVAAFYRNIRRRRWLRLEHGKRFSRGG